MFRITAVISHEYTVQFFAPTEEIKNTLLRSFRQGRSVRVVTQDLNRPEHPGITYDLYQQPLYATSTALTEEELSDYYYGREQIVRIQRLSEVDDGPVEPSNPAMLSSDQIQRLYSTPMTQSYETSEPTLVTRGR